MSDSLKFGTSGLRGLASELVGEETRRYTAAFVRHLRSMGEVTRVLVGQDLRASSPAIANDVFSALAGVEIEAVDCGALPTPALALEALRLQSARDHGHGQPYSGRSERAQVLSGER